MHQTSQQGIIYGYDGVRDAFHTGRGRIVLRAKVSFEQIGNRDAIIVSEIPYQVNKAEMIARTAELVKEEKSRESMKFVMSPTEKVFVLYTN